MPTEETTKPELRQAPGAQRSPRFRLANFDIKLVRLFLIAVFISLAMSLAKPETFPTLTNFRSMSVQFPEIGILALAIMITMLTGGIDLSITSIGNLAAVLMALTLTKLVPADAGASQAIVGVGAALLVSLLTGVVCGLFNGLLIANVGIT